MTVAVLWVAALVTIAAVRISSPPYHGIDRRIDMYEWVDLLRWVAEIPLVIAAIVTTVAWVGWHRGWWAYQLTLLLMSASVIYSAVMADWTLAYQAVAVSYPVPLRRALERDVRLLWSTVQYEWDHAAPFVPFIPYLLVLGAAAFAPRVVRLLRRNPDRQRVTAQSE